MVSEWGGELIDTDHVVIHDLAQRFGLALDDLRAAMPAGATNTYYFDGRYYPFEQAVVDFEPVFAALQKAATATPGLKPLKAEARDLFRRPLMPQELRDYDAVVFDPPRQGAQAQVQQIAASKIPVVIAVSCNVATFARDARILIDGGYRIEGVTPVDQFRHTPHIELVARFVLKR